METLKKRLHEAGVTRFHFVVQDDDDLVVEASAPRSEDDIRDPAHTIHVKTLVWEAVVENDTNLEEASSPTSSIYCVTALHYKDRVDENKLKEHLRRTTRTPARQKEENEEASRNGVVINLKLADTTTAEALTGYMSGAIPPMGHSTPMMLILDKTLVVGNNNPSSAPTNGGHDILDTLEQIEMTPQSNKSRILSTGSGSFRHALHIRLDDLMNCAKSMTSGVSVAPISVQKQQHCQPPQEHVSLRETISSNSRDNDDGELGSDDEEEFDAFASLALPVSEEIKSLSKLLRDAALRKGRSSNTNVMIVKTVISQAGGRFPELFQLGTEVNFSRTAMHLACWKGDLELVELLIHAGNQHGMDLVNTISTGEGNKGKTRTLCIVVSSLLSCCGFCLWRY